MTQTPVQKFEAAVDAAHAMPTPRLIARGSGFTSSLHPSGPKWTLECGHCAHAWRGRVPKIDHPTLHCPRCDGPNVVPITWSA